MSAPASAAQKTETPAAPPPAIAAAADPETVAREKRRASDGAIRAATKTLYEAFRLRGVDLGTFGASLLAAHVHSTVEDAGAWTADEAKKWAEDFRRLNPVLWRSVSTGNPIDFHAQLKRHRIEAPKSATYANLASLIRG